METEEQSENSLRTVALVLLCCGAVKMLHLLGVISVEGECAQVCVASRCVRCAAWQGSHGDKMSSRGPCREHKSFFLFLFHCLDYFQWLYLLSLPLADVLVNPMKVNDGKVFFCCCCFYTQKLQN